MIHSFEKTTLTDYPGQIASIVFTGGCNMKCPFCHNSDLIDIKGKGIDEEEILNYINKRNNILEGIVITGGEPLIHKDIKEFIKKIKNKKIKVKLDTNGINYKLLKELIDEDLIDYVAMDIKANKDNYDKVSGKKIDFNNIKKSIKLLNESNIDHEFRTTIVKEYHDLKIIEEIIKLIGKENKYYLQNFVDSEGVLKKGLHGFSDKELKEIEKELKERNPLISIRGLR